MSVVSEAVAVESKRGHKVHADLDEHMANLRKSGLVDCKVKVFVGRETTTQSLALALNNALRLHKNDVFKELDII